jgi:hypothetical protein
MSNILKIEGLKVFFEDGDVLKKDTNIIWMYHAFLDAQNGAWERRRWYTSENGLLELDFSTT